MDLKKTTKTVLWGGCAHQRFTMQLIVQTAF